MSNENGITVITPKTLDEARALAGILSKSSLLPDAFRGKEPETLMAIMTGAELGLAPMQSLRAIDVIKGKPTLKAETMTALVRARRDVCEYLVLRESSATRCVYETKRVGDPSPTTMTFSVDDARAAGLISNDNYKRFPAAMLRARCGSAICKAVYSDLVLGLYDPEELAEPSSSSTAIDAVASPSPRSTPPANDWSPEGAPLTEAARLEVAIGAAQSEVELNTLVERLGKLPKQSEAYARLRKMWGERRDVLKKSTPAPSAPPVEDVPWQTNEPEAQREPGAEG